MFERFTDDARALVGGLPRQARTFGHGYIAPEHLLLALVGTTTPAGAALRDCGLTPDRVEREMLRRIGRGPVSEGLFSDLDKDALAAIGIDLDTVLTAIESKFSGEALRRADIAIRNTRRARGPVRSRPRRLRPRIRLPRPRLEFRRGQRKFRLNLRPPGFTVWAESAPAVAAARVRMTRGAGHPDVSSARPVPFTPRIKRLLEQANRESRTRNDGFVGVEHIALALVNVKGGLAPEILFTLGGPAPLLRTAILDRYRKAG